MRVIVLVVWMIGAWAIGGEGAARFYFGEKVADRQIARTVYFGVGALRQSETTEPGALLELYNQDWVDYRVVFDESASVISVYYADEPEGKGGYVLPSGARVGLATRGTAPWTIRGNSGDSRFERPMVRAGDLPLGTRVYFLPEAANGKIGMSAEVNRDGAISRVMLMRPKVRDAEDTPPGYRGKADAGTSISYDGPEGMRQPQVAREDFVLGVRRTPAAKGGERVTKANPGRFHRMVDKQIDFGMKERPGGTVLEIANLDWIPYRIDIDDNRGLIAFARAGERARAGGNILPPGGCAVIPTSYRPWVLTGDNGRRVEARAGTHPVTVITLLQDYADREFGMRVWVDDNPKEETVPLLTRRPREAKDWPAGLDPEEYAAFREPWKEPKGRLDGPTAEALLDRNIPKRHAVTNTVDLNPSAYPDGVSVTIANQDWTDYAVILNPEAADFQVRRYQGDILKPGEVALRAGESVRVRTRRRADHAVVLHGDEPEPVRVETDGCDVVMRLLAYRNGANFGARVQINDETGYYPRLLTPEHRAPGEWPYGLQPGTPGDEAKRALAEEW